MTRQFLWIGVLSAALLASGSPTMAQGPMGNSQRGGMMGHGMMGMDWQDMPMRFGSMAEGRIAFLRAELGITKEQEPAFDEFAAAVRASTAKMGEMRQMMMQTMQGQGSASERYDARVQMMEARLEAMKATRDALLKLYAALTDEQKLQADQLIGMGMMM
jgi:hypothetical protein